MSTSASKGEKEESIKGVPKEKLPTISGIGDFESDASTSLFLSTLYEQPNSSKIYPDSASSQRSSSSPLKKASSEPNTSPNALNPIRSPTSNSIDSRLTSTTGSCGSPTPSLAIDRLRRRASETKTDAFSSAKAGKLQVWIHSISFTDSRNPPRKESHSSGSPRSKRPSRPCQHSPISKNVKMPRIPVPKGKPLRVRLSFEHESAVFEVPDSTRVEGSVRRNSLNKSQWALHSDLSSEDHRCEFTVTKHSRLFSRLKIDVLHGKRFPTLRGKARVSLASIPEPTGLLSHKKLRLLRPGSTVADPVTVCLQTEREFGLANNQDDTVLWESTSSSESREDNNSNTSQSSIIEKRDEERRTISKRNKNVVGSIVFSLRFIDNETSTRSAESSQGLHNESGSSIPGAMAAPPTAQAATKTGQLEASKSPLTSTPSTNSGSHASKNSSLNSPDNVSAESGILSAKPAFPPPAFSGVIGNASQVHFMPLMLGAYGPSKYRSRSSASSCSSPQSPAGMGNGESSGSLLYPSDTRSLTSASTASGLLSPSVALTSLHRTSIGSTSISSDTAKASFSTLAPRPSQPLSRSSSKQRSSFSGAKRYALLPTTSFASTYSNQSGSSAGESIASAVNRRFKRRLAIVSDLLRIKDSIMGAGWKTTIKTIKPATLMLQEFAQEIIGWPDSRGLGLGLPEWDKDGAAIGSDYGKEVKDKELVKELLFYYKYSMASYGWMGLNYAGKGKGLIRDSFKSTKTVILEYLDKSETPEHLLHLNMSRSDIYKPYHYVLYEAKTQELIICIRGTMSLSDMLTDVMCEYMVFREGLAHMGMVRSAAWIFEELVQRLPGWLKEHDVKRVVLVGHSMGAGVATLLTRLLLESLKDWGKLRRGETAENDTSSMSKTNSSTPEFTSAESSMDRSKPTSHPGASRRKHEYVKVHAYCFAPPATIGFDFDEELARQEHAKKEQEEAQKTVSRAAASNMAAATGKGSPVAESDTEASNLSHTGLPSAESAPLGSAGTPHQPPLAHSVTSPSALPGPLQKVEPPAVDLTPHVTAMVFGEDLIPRLCYGNIMDYKDMLNVASKIVEAQIASGHRQKDSGEGYADDGVFGWMGSLMVNPFEGFWKMGESWWWGNGQTGQREGDSETDHKADLGENGGADKAVTSSEQPQTSTGNNFGSALLNPFRSLMNAASPSTSTSAPASSSNTSQQADKSSAESSKNEKATQNDLIERLVSSSSVDVTEQNSTADFHISKDKSSGSQSSRPKRLKPVSALLSKRKSMSDGALASRETTSPLQESMSQDQTGNTSSEPRTKRAMTGIDSIRKRKVARREIISQKLVPEAIKSPLPGHKSSKGSLENGLDETNSSVADRPHSASIRRWSSLQKVWKAVKALDLSAAARAAAGQRSTNSSGRASLTAVDDAKECKDESGTEDQEVQASSRDGDMDTASVGIDPNNASYSLNAMGASGADASASSESIRSVATEPAPEHINGDTADSTLNIQRQSVTCNGSVDSLNSRMQGASRHVSMHPHGDTLDDGDLGNGKSESAEEEKDGIKSEEDSMAALLQEHEREILRSTWRRLHTMQKHRKLYIHGTIYHFTRAHPTTLGGHPVEPETPIKGTPSPFMAGQDDPKAIRVRVAHRHDFAHLLIKASRTYRLWYDHYPHSYEVALIKALEGLQREEEQESSASDPE